MTDRANNESWCFVSCDPTICPQVPRHRSHLLWAADSAGVGLCFSYEACGGTDFLAAARANCSKRGGYLFEGMCTCDIRPGSCVQTVSIAFTRAQDLTIISLCTKPLAAVQTTTINATTQQTAIPGGNSVFVALSTLAAVIAALVVVIVAVGVTWAFRRRKQEEKGKLLLGENMGISLVNKPTFRPIEGAFVIPFEQLQLGPIIAAGAQGQVRKGFFSGNAVAIKELIASLFDPEETEALKV